MVIEAEELIAPLGDLPPVDFCCAYGSSLLPNPNEESMVDYILGVSDPLQWHTENLKRNRGHYASCTAYLGPKPITLVADLIGTGVHFNPFVPWKNKMIKYGVVRMQDLACDILTWNRFYLSGRLQKPVSILVDNLDIRKANKVNLKAAVAAALLLLPYEFSEEELYSAICSLSYMGDLRMIFAEDKHKVKKIVRGSFQLFQNMYKPFLVEFSEEGLLQSSYNVNQKYFKQDRGLSATHSLFYSLPSVIQSETHRPWVGCNAGTVVASPITIASREEAAKQTRRALKRLVMVSSLRQVMSGFLAAGGFNAIQYLGNKMSKAWKSRASSYP